MNRKFLTVLSFAAGIAAISATTSGAHAGDRVYGSYGGWQGKYDRHAKPRFHRRTRHGHYGFYGRDNFSPNCHRYLLKARWSGHRHWWRKYNRCIRAEY